MLILLIHILFN